MVSEREAGNDKSLWQFGQGAEIGEEDEEDDDADNSRTGKDITRPAKLSSLVNTHFPFCLF